jgi:hypothetical protein
MSAAEQIIKLKELQKSGALSESEFTAEKARILLAAGSQSPGSGVPRWPDAASEAAIATLVYIAASYVVGFVNNALDFAFHPIAGRVVTNLLFYLNYPPVTVLAAWTILSFFIFALADIRLKLANQVASAFVFSIFALLSYYVVAIFMFGAWEQRLMILSGAITIIVMVAARLGVSKAMKRFRGR